jgi:hypothetical protein
MKNFQAVPIVATVGRDMEFKPESIDRKKKCCDNLHEIVVQL